MGGTCLNVGCIPSKVSHVQHSYLSFGRAVALITPCAYGVPRFKPYTENKVMNGVRVLEEFLPCCI